MRELVEVFVVETLTLRLECDVGYDGKVEMYKRVGVTF